MRLPQDRILHIDTEFKDGKVNITAEWQGEIVRCKDCKHHKERGWYNICDIHVGNGYPDNWFCADGERRE